MGRKGTPFSTSNLWLKASLTSDCYNSKESHTAIVRGPNLNVVFDKITSNTDTAESELFYKNYSRKYF